MKRAYVFPGQGAQFIGMGKSIVEQFPTLQQYFDISNEILGYNIQDVINNGTADDLKQTKVTQPAIFIHSLLAYYSISDPQPGMVAGHSLGEFSALVAAKVFSFEEGLSLVYQRATAMQLACEQNPSTMAAILGLDDNKVEEVCQSIEGEVVVAANYNCPGQLVISGSNEGIAKACEAMKSAGAKRALPLQVGGAFHSPLMMSAQNALAEAIMNTNFNKPVCMIYQNVDAMPHSDPETIKENLIKQLTAPVRWTQTVQNMVKDGATEFIECGPGNVLQGLIKKIAIGADTRGIS